MLGLGGGMILSPFLVELGLHPEAAPNDTRLIDTTHWLKEYSRGPIHQMFFVILSQPCLRLSFVVGFVELALSLLFFMNRRGSRTRARKR